jgi:hypothetical protein
VFDFPANPLPGEIYEYGSTKYQYNGYGWSRQARGGGDPIPGVPDGDKGDIIASGGGFIWTLDPTVVTPAARALLDDPSVAAQRTTLGIGNVDNTSDANKPVSGATQAALNTKYDKSGGPISGAATVAGDFSALGGRIWVYGYGSNPDASVIALNQSGSKYLHQDGVNLNVQGTPVKITNGTQSTSSVTGALTVGGGLGIWGNVVAGGVADIGGALTARGTTTVTNGILSIYNYGGTADAALMYWGQSGTHYIHHNGVLWNFVGSKVNFADTTDATSYAAAAVTLAGGLGVQKAIRTGGEIISNVAIRSGSYTFFGASNLHYAGPADANTEVHYFGSGRGWVYNKSTGNLIWANASGAGLTINDNGDVVAARNFYAGVISGTGLNVGAGAIVGGSLNVSGAATVGQDLSCQDLFAAGILQSGAALQLYNDPGFGFVQGGGYRYQHFDGNFYWLYNQAGGGLIWTGPGGQPYVHFREDAALIMAFDRAYKPGGGPWGDSSDSRIKNVLGNYALGLDAIKQLRPVRYTFKGNDTNSADGPSPHAAVLDKEFVGLIAQEVEAVLPDMVEAVAGYIDGVAVPDLRTLNTTALIYTLVNAVKTLASRVEALEAA